MWRSEDDRTSGWALQVACSNENRRVRSRMWDKPNLNPTSVKTPEIKLNNVSEASSLLHATPHSIMLFQPSLAFTLLAGLATRTLAADVPIPLNITAISSRNGYSVLECWQLASIPVDAMSAANYALGETSKATWSIIEPRTHIGQAWAPHVQ
jgi:hypothetical protein